MDEYSRQIEKDINNAALENMQDYLAAANRFRIFGVVIILVAAFVIIALQAWSMQKIEKGVSDLNEKVVHLNSLTGDVADNVYDIMEQKTTGNTVSNANPSWSKSQPITPYYDDGTLSVWVPGQNENSEQIIIVK